MRRQHRVGLDRDRWRATDPPTGIHRHELRTTKPFVIKLDLDGLVPGRKA
ncbi:hypothetical protein TPA0907_02200 [Micromonospora humidisoli]|nr:hypothetical protein [Micromonospora sp. AKA109]GHJ05853.1 hypothetical protein TPA0907_02200 [Micromonospora sp. AKA109]